MTYNSCGCSAALNGLFVFKIKYDAKKNLQRITEQHLVSTILV